MPCPDRMTGFYERLPTGVGEERNSGRGHPFPVERHGDVDGFEEVRLLVQLLVASCSVNERSPSLTKMAKKSIAVDQIEMKQHTCS